MIRGNIKRIAKEILRIYIRTPLFLSRFSCSLYLSESNGNYIAGERGL
jgi:hypothetical protein